MKSILQIIRECLCFHRLSSFNHDKSTIIMGSDQTPGTVMIIIQKIECKSCHKTWTDTTVRQE